MPAPKVHVEDDGASQPDSPKPTMVDPSQGQGQGQANAGESAGDPEPATPQEPGSEPQRFDNNGDLDPIVCDGKYRAGETFKRSCNSCSCSEDGQVRCTLMACLPAAK